MICDLITSVAMTLHTMQFSQHRKLFAVFQIVVEKRKKEKKITTTNKLNS